MGDAMGVRRGGAFDTVLDGACEADRPVAEKKNKKWKPDCTEKSTAAYHPFMKVGDYVKCYEKTVEAFGYLALGRRVHANRLKKSQCKSCCPKGASLFQLHVSEYRESKSSWFIAWSA